MAAVCLSVPVCGHTDDLYPCGFEVVRFEDYVLRAWYPHEWPRGEHYHDDHAFIAPADATVYPAAEGHPVAFQWIHDGEVEKTCGEVPSERWVIFEDGFDDGGVDAWN